MRMTLPIAGAVVIMLAGCSAGTGASPSETQTTVAESTADAGSVAGEAQSPPKWPTALIGRTDCNDGVKGVIENYTDAVITVTAGGTSAGSADLEPGQGAVFYDCAYQTWTGLDVTPPARRGIALTVKEKDSSATPAYFSLVDDLLLQPFTLFKADGVITFRNEWKEGDSHHDVSSGTDLWIKRDADGWDGGHETSGTSDWPVFTIHVDKAS